MIQFDEQEDLILEPIAEITCVLSDLLTSIRFLKAIYNSLKAAEFHFPLAN